MTTYGMKIKNPSGGLVVASDGFGLNYLGRAWLVAYETALDMNNPATGTKPQWMRYRITTPSPVVVPFLALSALCCGVAKVVRSGSTWDFIVFNQDSSNNPIPISVFCFGRPTTHSPFGLRIRQNDGVTLAYEFGLNRPLMFAGVVDMGAGVNSATIPGVSSPAVMGFALGFVDPLWILVNAARGQWRSDARVVGWTLSGSVISRTERQARSDGEIVEFGVGESPGSEDYRGRATTAFIIDANGLP